MKCIKTARLGTFRDVSSLETLFSYYGRMSVTNIQLLQCKQNKMEEINIL